MPESQNVVENVIVRIPKKFAFLATTPSRYKVIWGGRGKGASWSVARVLLEKAHSRKIFVLCAREIQNSIAESVHRLLSQQIDALGLSEDYDIQAHSIYCKTTGSQFVFMGLFRNVNKIKSLEGVDYMWIEEAENTSEETFQLVLPTIRKDGSEIWMTFNTDQLSEDDPVYMRFVVNKPENCITCFATFDDNPYFPDVLRLEMESDRSFRPSVYKVVWKGELAGKGGKMWDGFIGEQYPKGHIRDFGLNMLVERKALCYMACDPAQHYYPACLWIARIPSRDRNFPFYSWVYNEWPTFDTFGDYFHVFRKKLKYTGSLQDLAREIYHQDGTGQFGLQITRRFIDTRFATGSGSGNVWSNQTVGLVSEWRKPENGTLDFNMPSVKMIDAQKSAITRDMQYNTLLPISDFNSPHYFVAPWCRNTIDMHKNHRLEQDSEKENEKRKDFSDALRILYAGMTSDVPAVKSVINDDEFAYSGHVAGSTWMGT